MDKKKNRIKTKLLKMIQKYEKCKRISDAMESTEYSDSWLYKYRRYDRPWRLKCKIELYMLEHYNVSEAMVSDVLEGRSKLDDVLALTDPDAETKTDRDYLCIPYVHNAVSCRDKRLNNYYRVQRAKQGWCYYDAMDINYALNAYTAGILETYVCKAADYHRPCWYFVEEYYQKHGETLPLSFEEFEKCWKDQYKQDPQLPPEFEMIKQQVRDYEFKTIRKLAETLRLGADIDGAAYQLHDGEKRVKDAKEAFRKIIEFYDELID